MKKKLIVLFVFTAILIMQGQAYAAPLTVQGTAKAINYRNLKGTVNVYFKGTAFLPAAKGVAVVRTKAGMVGIKATFKNLTSAAKFGPEYLTYILWAISPDGQATNLGELIVKDGKSKLNATTNLQALSLLVTAEPYFAVSQPSNFVILENAIKPGNKTKIELIDAKYELLPRGEYTKNITAADLKPQSMDENTPFSVYQARNAVRIAKAAGAAEYAADGFKNAERLLALAETKKGGRESSTMTAREAVKSAEDSRVLAVKHQADQSAFIEHQQDQAQVNRANREADTAIVGQIKAEDAQSKAEQAKGQSDTERDEALALAGSAVAYSYDFQEEAKAARAEAKKSQGQADAANNRAQKAEGEKAVLRAQLLRQLNSILQTCDSARGLIVNMSDALFKTGSSGLMQPVREKLSKIAGIVSSHPDLKLSVEGHTDSVGSDEFNQQLSEKRARTALDYLVSQGVPANSIVSRGFGKTNPIESNDTPQGRKNNRRVEIVVSGEAIGTLVMAN